jgi:hypothetical protein
MTLDTTMQKETEKIRESLDRLVEFFSRNPKADKKTVLQIENDLLRMECSLALESGYKFTRK